MINNLSNIIEGEQWLPIRNYEGLYSVSNFGRVRRESYTQILPNGAICKIKEHILKPLIGSNDYLYVQLCKNNKVKKYSIHRLVAIAFIPNPNNLPEVNHIDHNRKNAHVNNLEWCDRMYNVHHRDGILRAAIKESRAVDRYSMDGEFIDTWYSQHEFYRKYNIKGDGLILKACKKDMGVYSAYGYRWKFHGDDSDFKNPPVKGKRIIQKTSNNEYINSYDNACIASKETGVSYTGICKCAREKSETSGGYIWEYEKQEVAI